MMTSLASCMTALATPTARPRPEPLADIPQPQQRRVAVLRLPGGWHLLGAGGHPARVSGPGAFLGAVRYHVEAPTWSSTVIITRRYRTWCNRRCTGPRTAGTPGRTRP